VKVESVDRFGQPKSNLPSATQRQVDRATARATTRRQTDVKPPQQSPEGPKRTPAAEARRAKLREKSKDLRAELKRSRNLSPKQRAALQRKYDDVAHQLTGRPKGVNQKGEVRLQGGAVGNKYQTGIDSGTRDGRVGKVGPHDGAVSRQYVSKTAKHYDAKGRSPEARAQANATMKEVKSRRGIDQLTGRKKGKLKPSGLRKRLKARSTVLKIRRR